MIKKLLFLTQFIFLSGIASAQLNNVQDSLSYAIGVNIGSNIKSQGVELNREQFFQAVSDILDGANLQIPASDCNSYIQNYFQNLYAQKANANMEKGVAFLRDNKTKEGVTTTASGLQYTIVKLGDGPKPTTADRVKVHYHGTLLDGSVFDSSVDRGTPSTFGVTQVIKGWIEGLQLMPLGSKFKFYIPSNLAYGSRGSGKIGPNEVLIFDVELIEIVKEG